MSLYFLKPALKETIWGGNKLKDEYGFKTDLPNIAEAWMLSGHPDGQSTVIGGKYDGKNLSDVITDDDLGTHKPENTDDFPVLIKFIDAKRDLSVQVHPDDKYAAAHEKDVRGKTEAWYIIDAEPDAKLIYGFKEKISKQEFEDSIYNNTLLDKVNLVNVKKGDVAFIESGTLHAIGKGIFLAEVQQSCNTTYRVYDYNRPGKDGKPRELHIKKAVDVTKTEPPKYSLAPKGERTAVGSNFITLLMECRYFRSSLLELDGSFTTNADKTSFISFIVIDGEGFVTACGEKRRFKKGDSILVTAGSGQVKLTGGAEILVTTI